MARPATLRVYLDGATIPYATLYAADGEHYAGSLDLPEGTHTVQVTAQRVGEAESSRSQSRTVVVGAATAPTITSPEDWTEIRGSASVTVTVQANADEVVRFYANGVQKAEITANGAGVATATFALDSAGLQCLDPVEVLTACRVVAGQLSHPSPAVHVVPTYGRLVASGVTTARLIMGSALLSHFRFRPMPTVTWDGELISNATKSVYHYRRGDPAKNFILPSYVGGLMPGYCDPVYMRNVANRICGPEQGATNFNFWYDGTAYPYTPYFNDACLLMAAAYFRGDRSAYAAYKAKTIEVFDHAPRSGSGLIIHGKHVFSCGLVHGNVVVNGPGGTFGNETEGTARYVLAARLLKKIALIENDAATAALCDTYIAGFQTALATMVLTSGTDAWKSMAGLLDGQEGSTWDPVDHSTEGAYVSKPNYAATGVAIAVDALPPTELANAITALRSMVTSRFGGDTGNGSSLYKGNWPGPVSPALAGAVHYFGMDYVRLTEGHPYAEGRTMGAFATAIARADPTLGRQLAEDYARWAMSWWSEGALVWLGWSFPEHVGVGNRNSHSTYNTRHSTYESPAWFAEADDRYADLAPLTLAGSAGSEVEVRTELGHRITQIEVTCSTPVTSAVIEVSGYENTFGWANLLTACRTNVQAWPDPSVDYGYAPGSAWGAGLHWGPAQVMATINVTGSGASKLSGLVPVGCYSGGKIKARVVNATWPGAPGTFTVTLKQSKITPTFTADSTLGFCDNFTSDRLAEYTVIEGSKNNCSISTRTDVGALQVAKPYLLRTELNVAAAGWTSLLQSATNFADGAVLVDRVRVPSATVDQYGNANALATLAVFLRVSNDLQNFIRVRVTPPTPGLNRYRLPITGTVDEVVGGVLVNSQSIPTNFTPYDDGYDTEQYLDNYPGNEDRYLYVVLRGTKLQLWAWGAGGWGLPYEWGGLPDYCDSPFKQFFTVSNVTAAGMAGFGVYDNARVDSVRICGMQDQPIPPGFMLDTGLALPVSEVVVPSCFLGGEIVVPASPSSCLRNEWGAQVSDVATGYNARWSY